MARVKVDTIELDGKTYDIFVRDNGKWEVPIGDDDAIVADTKEKALDQLRRWRRKGALVNIPATIVDTGYHDELKQMERVTITGLHSRNRSILYTDARGKKHTDGSKGDFYTSLTDEEITEGRTLFAAKRAAIKAWDDWLEAREFADSVDTVIRKAQGLPDDNEE